MLNVRELRIYGVGDETSKIQAALNLEVPLQFNDASYTVSKPLLPRPGSAIHGLSPELTRFKYSLTGWPADALGVFEMHGHADTHLKGVAFRDISIKGEYVTALPPSQRGPDLDMRDKAFHISFVDDVLIQNVLVEGVRNEAIYFQGGCIGVRIENTKVRHCARTGINFNGWVQRSIVRGCEVSDVGAHGLESAGSELIIESNIFDRFGKWGILVGEIGSGSLPHSYATCNDVHGNQVYRGDNSSAGGICLVYGPRMFSVTNNTVKECAGHGILIDGSVDGNEAGGMQNPAKEILVQGNRLFDNGTAHNSNGIGIALYDVKRTVVANNYLINSEGGGQHIGIRVRGVIGDASVFVRHNTIYGPCQPINNLGGYLPAENIGPNDVG